MIAAPRLTLPASPQGGRRTLRIAASASAHGIVALLLVVAMGRVAEPNQPEAAAPAQKIVWVAPVLPPSKPATPAPVPAEAPVPAKPKVAPPTEYAAAPTSAAPARDWHELLPQALALQAKGLAAPSFVVNNLDKDIVTMLVSRRLAILVAGKPPFDRDARPVRWVNGAVEGGALPQGWAQRVARRAIVLPHSWVEAVAPTNDDRVYLLISTDLDAAILAAQLAVAEQHRVGLQAVLRTYGRLLSSPDGTMTFQIDSVDLSR